MYPNLIPSLNFISPLVFSSKLHKIESIVDLPQPEGPTIDTNSPSNN